MVGMGVFLLVAVALGKQRSFSKVIAKCFYYYIDSYVFPMVSNGAAVCLPKIGTIKMKKNKARYGHDVLTRRRKFFPPTRGIKFVASAKLKDLLNENIGLRPNAGITYDIVDDVSKKFELDAVLVHKMFNAWGDVAFIVMQHKERLVIPKIGTLYVSDHIAKRAMNVVTGETVYMQDRRVVNIKINKNLRTLLN